MAAVPAYNPNFFLVKAVAGILEEIFPYERIGNYPEGVDREDYFTYGYYLKVYLSGYE